MVTISGTPTASGTFNYTVTLTGGCGVLTATGTITVNPNNTVILTSAAGTNNQTLCINTAITNITYATTGATGATVTGLPAGVSGVWAANVVTISGTPTASGTFNYTVTLTGGCSVVTATGTITVNPNNTVILTSAAGTNAQTLCINTAITTITYATTGATGATITGLPAGVAGSWAANVVTISGTPTASGTFTYTVTLTGGCSTVTATGSITVTPNNTVILTSAVGTNNQAVCINLPIATITYATTGATGATITGLPAGVTGTWAANVVTISGTPTASGIFNYNITLTGGCGTVTATGTITVFNSIPVVITIPPANVSVCEGNTATFSVTATGTVVGYQWQVSTFLVPAFTNIAGATSSSYTTAATIYTMNGNAYRCVITSVCAGNINSTAAVLTVNQRPIITLSANRTALSPGANATAVIRITSVVPAAGVTFVWRKNGVILAGVTGTSLNIGLDDIGIYNVTVTDVNSCTGISNDVVITHVDGGHMFIYPNPNGGKFQVRYYSPTGYLTPRTINVYDALGQLVFTHLYTVNSSYERMDVDLSNHASGTYTVELRNNGGDRIALAKVIIQ